MKKQLHLNNKNKKLSQKKLKEKPKPQAKTKPNLNLKILLEVLKRVNQLGQRPKNNKKKIKKQKLMIF